MLKVAITGGIGCGKTTVCNIFETLQIPVLNADAVAKNVMQKNSEIVNFISNEFGENCYDKNILQTKILANIVFSDAQKLQLLNSKVHPIVQQNVQSWFAQCTTPYAIYESALLIESNSYKNVDAVIGVQAALELRIQRVMQRSNLSTQQVSDRINKQLSEAEKEKFYNYIIQNNTDTLLIPQVLQIHKILLHKVHEQ